jgi:hypothetical protein
MTYDTPTLSWAVAVKPTIFPLLIVDPFAGLVILTVGAVLSPAGVGVGGTGVAVGGIGVAVGGTGVEVGGTGVAVGASVIVGIVLVPCVGERASVGVVDESVGDVVVMGGVVPDPVVPAA